MNEILIYMAQATRLELFGCYIVLILAFCIFGCIAAGLMGIIEHAVPESFYVWIFKKMDVPYKKERMSKHV